MSKAAGPSLGAKVENVNPEELYRVLLAASSQDPTMVKQSTDRLKQMLDMFGTFDALQDIASKRQQIPLIVRQQAIIQFKNNAPGHWRSRKLMSEEHRQNIRERCFQFLEEEDDTITRCNEEIVGKLARQEYPRAWPNLLSELLGIIDSNLKVRYSNMSNEEPRTFLVLQRCLRLLHAVLKELVAIKMPHGIESVGQITASYSAMLIDYYNLIASPLFSTSEISILSTSRASNDILLAHLLYKSVIRIATWLWQRMERAGRNHFDSNRLWFLQVYEQNIERFKVLIELRLNVVLAVSQAGITSSETRQSIDLLTRHIKLYGKYFRGLQRFSVVKFVELPRCDELVLYYWGQVVRATEGPPEMIGETSDMPFPVKFLVQGMVLFKDSLSQWGYAKKKDGTLNERALKQDVVELAVRLLITRFMPLKPSDLESWMADPEEWVNMEDQDNDQWEFQIRPCSERVLAVLAAQHPAYVMPLLVQTFQSIAVESATDLASVIQKEALYCALGRCAVRLQGLIPFEAWLDQTLSAEVRSTNPLYPIIKRRIAWLIGRWVSDACTSPNNHRIWEILVYLLRDRGAGTDNVVRLTAAMSLKDCIGVLDLDIKIFEPHLSTTITELVSLMSEADTWESKHRITDTLNEVIERSGNLIMPFVGIITTPIPALWTEASDNWMLKTAVLGTMQQLVNATNADSSTLNHIIIPLVQDSMSAGAVVHLDEPGMKLWLDALRHSTTIHNSVGAPTSLELFPIAIRLCAENLDVLGTIVRIIQSYILLDAPYLLQHHGMELFTAFKSVLQQKKAVETNMRDILKCIHLILQLAPSALWGELLHHSGLFASMLDVLIENEAGMLFLLEDVYALSRLALVDSQMLLQLMGATVSSSTAATELQLWDGLLDHWIGKFDNLSMARFRKLSAMGLGALASTGRIDVVKRLPTDIFNLWLDVLYEIKEVEDEMASGEDVSYLRRRWEDDDPPHEWFDETADGTAEYDRRKMVWNQDPVRTLKFSTFITGRLQETEAVVGSQVFHNECIAKADDALVKQIQDQLARG